MCGESCRGKRPDAAAVAAAAAAAMAAAVTHN